MHEKQANKSVMSSVDLDLHLEGIFENWLERSYVGELWDISQAHALQEQLVLMGACTIQVRTMGDNLVLLTGKEGKQIYYLIANEQDWNKEHFSNFEPWSPLFVPRNRVVWLKCEGIPLNLWTRHCFESLVKKFGDLVSVDEGTSSFTYPDVARI